MKVSVAEKRAIKIEKEFCEAKIHDTEAKEAFRQQKEHADALSSGAVRPAIKVAKLQQKLADARDGEARANASMKVWLQTWRGSIKPKLRI